MKNLKLSLKKDTVEVLSKYVLSGGAGTGGFHTETVCTKYPCKDDLYTVNNDTCKSCEGVSCYAWITCLQTQGCISDPDCTLPTIIG